MLRKLDFKAIFCLFVLLFSLPLSGVEIRAEEQEADRISEQSELKLAAWNIEFLGRKKRNVDDLREIAKILNQYHFVAITELIHKKDLDKVMTILSKEMEKDYGCMVSPVVGWEDSRYKEYYAFVYDKDIVSVVDMGGLYPDSTNRQEGKFQRNPYWATFRAGEFDFSVIVVHVTWGENVKPRNAEVRALDAVYNYVQKENGDENDVLLVGDFNRWPDLKAFEDLKEIDTMKALFYKKDGHRSNTAKTPQLYDNILFQDKYLSTEYAKKYDVYEFDTEVFKGNREAAERVSNHLPVWAVFRIDLKDDD